jgi:NTE family protein
MADAVDLPRCGTVARRMAIGQRRYLAALAPASLARAMLLAVVILAAGCASTYRPYLNEPLRAASDPVAARTVAAKPAKDDGSLMLILSFSGGGTRAAALAYGVLEKLRDTRVNWNGHETSLLEHVDVISGVSGGSITAAYYAAFGESTFSEFKSRFLDRDFENDLITAALDPTNAFHLTSPWYGRGNLLADQFDLLLFHGLNYGQLLAVRPRPALIVMATDLSLGASFEFSERQFRRICSDLDDFPLAMAVAASNSVPIVFTPITLKNYAGSCPAAPMGTADGETTAATRRLRRYIEEQETYLDVNARPYIHLVDGGLSDNLGIQRIITRIALDGGISRWLESRRAHAIRKLVILNVDAGRHDSFSADRVDTIPSSMEVARGIQFGLLSHYAEETNDSFLDAVEAWRREMRSAAAGGRGPFTADADLYYIPVSLRDFPDAQTRQVLLALPTTYTLQSAQVDALIDAGHRILDVNPEFGRLLRDIGHSSTALIGHRMHYGDQ